MALMLLVAGFGCRRNDSAFLWGTCRRYKMHNRQCTLYAYQYNTGVCCREMWLSLLHHVVGIHSWTGGVKFHQCAHEERQGEEEMRTVYLDKDSPAFAALKSVVASPFLLRALPQLTQYCHTGDFEVYHSYLLKYCPKRQHFFYEGKSE